MSNDIYYFMCNVKYDIPYNMTLEEKINYFTIFRKPLSTKNFLEIFKKFNQNYHEYDSRKESIVRICAKISNIYKKDELIFRLSKRQFLDLIKLYKHNFFYIMDLIYNENKFEFNEKETLNIIKLLESKYGNIGNVVKKINNYIINPIFSGEDAYKCNTIEELYNCRSYVIHKIIEE